MAENSALQSGGGAGAQTASGGAVTVVGSDIVVDKNKTNEQYIEEAEAHYIIPKLVREKFVDLVKLIYETESMNQEEREYWMQILPIMTEDQIVKFREILVNERDQLQKLDQEYESEMSKINKPAAPAINEAEVKAKMEQIKKAEQSSEAEEKAAEAALLDQLEGL